MWGKLTVIAVYEFQGCFWHGCSKCYSGDIINVKNQIDMMTLKNKTEEKNRKIKQSGYNLIEVYECDLDKDKIFKEYFKQQKRDVVEPLNPRDAFFGGRTNVTKLRYNFKENEKGRYVDFCSLYPTVQYYKKYPVGHPTKILNPEKINRNWFGLIKCKVSPPRGLYHPVLPVKTKCGDSEKLLFPLCHTCPKEKKKAEKCQHTDEERSFIGTWCINELFKAIDKGYSVERIYEVWHFEKTTENMFKDYVKRFMKIKIESSPLKVGLNCTYKSEAEFKQVIKDKLGIELDEIRPNPGMRAIAKLS